MSGGIKSLADQLKSRIKEGDLTKVDPLDQKGTEEIISKDENKDNVPNLDTKIVPEVTKSKESSNQKNNNKKGGNKNQTKENQDLKERILNLENLGEKQVHLRLSPEILSKLQLLNYTENISHQKIIYYAIHSLLDSDEGIALLKKAKSKINELE